VTDMYTADVRWEDGQWQATVRDVPGAHTFARTTNALRKRLREVIVLMDDRPNVELEDEDAFTIALNVAMTVTDSVGLRDGVATLRGEGALSAPGHAAVSGSATLTGRGTLTATGSGGSYSAGAAEIATSPPDQALALAAEARRRAQEAESEAEHATTMAVLMAQQAGISLRDAALFLGLSHQRVQQIAAAGTAAREAAHAVS